MKETLNMECRAYLKSNAITLADDASGVYEASRQNKMDAVCDIVVTLAQRMFEGGWNAAIDYCMQPVEKEVPAEAATSDEHTNNTCEPILSGREDEVNACDCN